MKKQQQVAHAEASGSTDRGSNSRGNSAPSSPKPQQRGQLFGSPQQVSDAVSKAVTSVGSWGIVPLPAKGGNASSTSSAEGTSRGNSGKGSSGSSAMEAVKATQSSLTTHKDDLLGSVKNAFGAATTQMRELLEEKKAALRQPHAPRCSPEQQSTPVPAPPPPPPSPLASWIAFSKSLRGRLWLGMGTVFVFFCFSYYQFHVYSADVHDSAKLLANSKIKRLDLEMPKTVGATLGTPASELRAQVKEILEQIERHDKMLRYIMERFVERDTKVGEAGGDGTLKESSDASPVIGVPVPERTVSGTATEYEVQEAAAAAAKSNDVELSNRVRSEKRKWRDEATPFAEAVEGAAVLEGQMHDDESTTVSPALTRSSKRPDQGQEH